MACLDPGGFTCTIILIVGCKLYVDSCDDEERYVVGTVRHFRRHGHAHVTLTNLAERMHLKTLHFLIIKQMQSNLEATFMNKIWRLSHTQTANLGSRMFRPVRNRHFSHLYCHILTRIYSEGRF